jgi:hypothetical protein
MAGLEDDWAKHKRKSDELAAIPFYGPRRGQDA